MYFLPGDDHREGFPILAESVEAVLLWLGLVAGVEGDLLLGPPDNPVGLEGALCGDVPDDFGFSAEDSLAEVPFAGLLLGRVEDPLQLLRVEGE